MTARNRILASRGHRLRSQHLTNGSEPPTSIHWRPPPTPCSSAASPFQHDYHPRSRSELISLIVNQPLPRLRPPRRAGRCGSGAAPGPEQGPRPAVLLRVGVRTCHAACAIGNLGHATPLPVEGMPAYAKEHRASARATDQQDRCQPSSRRSVEPVGCCRRLFSAGDHRSGADIRLSHHTTWTAPPDQIPNRWRRPAPRMITTTAIIRMT